VTSTTQARQIEGTIEAVINDSGVGVRRLQRKYNAVVAFRRFGVNEANADLVDSSHKLEGM
jgi:hypothetical protein